MCQTITDCKQLAYGYVRYYYLNNPNNNELKDLVDQLANLMQELK